MDEVKLPLKSEISASIIQIIPVTFSVGKAMRIEIKSCPVGCQNIYLVSGTSHSIPDSAISATSSWDPQHGPHTSRLFKAGYPGSWVAAWDDTSPWIQVSQIPF